MKEKIGHTEKTWWIVYNDLPGPIHHGFVDVGNHMIAGMDILETFTNEDDWCQRLIVLGVDEDEIPLGL